MSATFDAAGQVNAASPPRDEDDLNASFSPTPTMGIEELGSTTDPVAVDFAQPKSTASTPPVLGPAILADPPPSFSANSYRWNRGRYSRQRRFVDIWGFVLRLLAARWLYGKAWSYGGGVITPEKQAQRRRQLAVWIRETLLDLGPTFIKVGQLFSTRADIFPLEFVEELSKLQDRVPAFSYEQTRSIVETDLGKPIPRLYRHFDPIPLAAASLGQVHRAELPSGEEVVVKVQRPGLRSL
ncbi:MAG: ABC1 kinase family protein, partial [Nodosilinea sp.]